MSSYSGFYDTSGSATRTARLSGTWVLVTDGTQTSSEAIIPPMYFGSFSSASSGDRSTTILPSNITLRISTLECTVSTPTMINFGSVERLTQVGAELATYSSAITTACSQTSDRINANINLQFRALTSLYENQRTRLALAQGGGYITGEINNGVTGSGVCTGTSGLPFDNSVVKIGNILATEATTVINNQVTWRLCSGGASLPVGNVTASAEMLVTFN
ncbi:adhesin [Yersinia artesiana]|uniref:adhesin n=1 Tax=Yersinia artesiana TaxID=2890315 RepID=UPI001D10FC74|nr:adhesin [Yersinia artesiana]